MPTLRNEMILASAGSGKTHMLVNRYLGLLRAGAPPEKLLALTFTRKAAAEFYSKILMRLSDALENEDDREALAEQLGMGILEPSEVCADLRRLVHSGPRLQLGTLDAFFVRILQAFYLEFGFSAGFTLLDDYSASEAARRAQQSAFKRLRDAQAVGAFLDGMRQASFGSEEKSLQRHLESFVSKHHGIFLKGSDEALWGGESAIWEKGCLWLEGGAFEVNGAASALMEAVRADARYTPKQDVGGWAKAVDLLSSARPDRLIRSRLNTTAQRLLEAGLDLREGSASLRFGRKDIALSAEQCRHAFTLVHHVMRCEIEAAQARTRGLWEVLRAYEAAYHQEVRSKGQLTFGDVQRLLAKGDLALTQDDAEESNSRLLEIAYRLDARSDHWMLDEFQDTSRVQWRIIANLVDEVVQGGLPDRSFFYVGDVKQAIYGWRDGDARLFHQIYDHYNQGREGTPEAIQAVTLNHSYRCCQTVIDTVNRVFSSNSTLRFQFGTALADRWQRVWGEHATHVDGPGYVALLNPAKEQSARSVQDRDRYAMAAETLKRLNPIERGLSCGVLVRQNKVGRDFADYLRKHSDLAVESEADVQVLLDNPVTSAFLSLLKAAAHPSDTLSWGHLRLTPFSQILDDLDWRHADLVREVLHRVHHEGLEATLRHWLSETESGGTQLDRFSRNRFEKLCDGAATFDARGERSLTKFLDYAERFEERQHAGQNAVQVLSVHKAKGLEFDVVLLLLAGTDDLRSLRHLSLVAHADEEEPIFVTGLGEQGQLHWALDMPHPTFAKVDPVLRHVLEARETEMCYENLCLLYVAMTRAKRALYMICDPVGRTSESNNYSRLLGETLAEGEPQQLSVWTPDGEKLLGHRLYSHGPRDWFEGFDPSTEEQAKVPSPIPEQKITLRDLAQSPLTKRRPSQEHRRDQDSVTLSGWEALVKQAQGALDYGNLLHALFEAIEWLDDFGQDWERSLPTYWDKLVPIPDPELRTKAHTEVLACLNNPEIQSWFSRSAQGGDDARVWREKAFEVMVGTEWVSGVFDRVMFPADGPATIIDFKSDRLSADHEDQIQKATARHAKQLEAYAEALRRLLKLAPSTTVRKQLIFSKTAKCHRV